MQVVVTVPDDVSARLQQMADEEQISVAEMLARIARQAVFATAPNIPSPDKSGATTKPRRSLLDLEGSGEKLWKDGGDAQEWVNKMREDRDPLTP